MRNIFFFILLLLNINYTFGFDILLSSVTGHYYEFVLLNHSHPNATLYCSSQPKHLGQYEGYLVTITTKEENDWIMARYNNYFSGNSFWMSGSVKNKNGVYFYNSGPENGTLLYDSFKDECGIYCDFSLIEPNFMYNANETSIQYYNLAFGWNNKIPTFLSYFICEYGGMEVPYIAPVSTGANVVTISRIQGWNLLGKSYNFTITFKNNRNDQFICSSPTIISNTSLTCTIPLGYSGKFNVTLDNGSGSQLKTQFQFSPPQITVMYPNFSKDSVISISGANLAKDSLISIYLANFSYECQNPTEIRKGIMTCTVPLDININDSMIPIDINSDGVWGQSKKFVFYYKDSRYFSCYKSGSNYIDTISYIGNITVEGLQSTMSYIDTEDTAILLRRMCTGFGGGLYWTSLVYNNNIWTTSSGPNKGISVSYYDISGTLSPPSNPSITLFYYDLNTYKYASKNTSETYSSGSLAEFYPNSPYFLQNKNYTIPTNGSIVNFDMNQFGTPFTNNYLTFRGKNITFFRNATQSKISIFIPEGAGAGPYPVSVTLVWSPTLSYSTPVGTQFISYEKPSINNTNTPDILGTIQINGINFNSNVSLVSVLVNGNQICSSPNIIKAHNTLECKLPIGYGTGNVTVVVDKQISQAMTFSYAPPRIESSSKISTRGGLLTLYGSNFYNDPLLLNITVGSLSCQNISIVTTNQVISCRVGPFALNQTTAFANVQLSNKKSLDFEISLSSYPTVLYATNGYRNRTTLLTISGTNFINDSILVDIAGESCYNISYISDISMTCYFDGKVAQINDSSLFVNITCGGISGGEFAFNYLKDEICPRVNNLECNGHGRCINGKCDCEEGWTVYSNCSTSGGKSDPPIINNGTIINPSGINFTSAFIYIRELDNLQNTIKLLDMANITWNRNNVTNEITGMFPNETVIVRANITVYNQSTEIVFAGETIFMPSNSIKYTIAVSNWDFQDKLNTLQLIFQTKTDGETFDECGRAIPVGSEVSENAYQVIADRAILNVNFAKHFYSDGRIMLSNYKVLDRNDPLVSKKSIPSIENGKKELILTMAIQTSSFEQFILVDPSISSLVITRQSVGQCSKSNKWKVIVIAVVCSVVGAAILVTSAILIRRKLKWSKEERSLKMKEFSQPK